MVSPVRIRVSPLLFCRNLQEKRSDARETGDELGLFDANLVPPVINLLMPQPYASEMLMLLPGLVLFRVI